MTSTTRLFPSLTRPLVHSFRPSIRSLSFKLPRQSTSSLLSIHQRSFTTTPYRFEAPPSTGTPIGRIDRRLKIFFTCTASVPVDLQNAQPGADARPCGHRSSHEFSKRSYEKGVVIVQCPECENRHLIGQFSLILTFHMLQSTDNNSYRIQRITSNGSLKLLRLIIQKVSLSEKKLPELSKISCGRKERKSGGSTKETRERRWKCQGPRRKRFPRIDGRLLKGRSAHNYEPGVR